MKRTVFFISDGTGITAETMGYSLLAQFDTIDFDQVTIPYVTNEQKLDAAISRINKALLEDDLPPVVFSTIINDTLRAKLAQSKAFMMDIFSSFLKPLEEALGAESSYSVGKVHSIIDDKKYQVRIDSVNYALDNDDGARTRYYDKADVILVGVSRSGKTPTCLYLALQFGIKAANYPLTDDDLDDLELPKALREHRSKLFGLSIEPERLTAIRTERKPNSRYASMGQCESEVRGAEAIFNRYGIPFVNSTHASIEEISTKVIEAAGIKRRLA